MKIKYLLVLLAAMMLASCSNKIVMDTKHSINTIKSMPGYYITAVRWDGLAFGRTVDDYKKMIEAQFPDCYGIFSDTSEGMVFYVILKANS